MVVADRVGFEFKEGARGRLVFVLLFSQYVINKIISPLAIYTGPAERRFNGIKLFFC